MSVQAERLSAKLTIIQTRAGFDPAYQVEHLNAKGRVGEFIQNQPSVVSDTELSWTAVNTGVYMEMLEVNKLSRLVQ